MSGSFPRAMRAMQLETSGRSPVVLLLVIVLVSAWLVWLGSAQLPVYLRSDAVVLMDSTEAVAQFEPDAWLKIRPGQSGSLRLTALADPIPVTVVDLAPAEDEDLISVRFALKPTSSPLQAGLRGHVEIEVEQVTPLNLLFRIAQ